MYHPQAPREEAKALLVHYLGKEIDHEEVETIVDLIIQAAVDEVRAGVPPIAH